MTVMELDLRANPMRIEHRVIPQARQAIIIELRSAVTKCASTSCSSTKENVLAAIAKAVKLHSVVPMKLESGSQNSAVLFSSYSGIMAVNGAIALMAFSALSSAMGYRYVAVREHAYPVGDLLYFAENVTGNQKCHIALPG